MFVEELRELFTHSRRRGRAAAEGQCQAEAKTHASGKGREDGRRGIRRDGALSVAQGILHHPTGIGGPLTRGLRFKTSRCLIHGCTPYDEELSEASKEQDPCGIVTGDAVVPAVTDF